MSTQTRTLHTDPMAVPSAIRVSHVVAAVSAVVWLTLVIGGLVYVWNYANKPGQSDAAAKEWPSASVIQTTPDQATLVMIAHPQCPCTRASIGELAAIMSHCEGRLRAVVLFLKPEGSPESWVKSDLWTSAANIPGVEVIGDPDGDEARRFRASTSGFTLLYDLNGHLVFSGGITSSRGHSGDNTGRSAIVALVNQEVPVQTTTAVFGCPLFSANDECPITNHETTK